MDNADNIIVLVDENNEEIEFEYLDTVEYQELEYVILTPVSEEEDDDDELNVVIFKIEHMDEEDSFVVVEDQTELESVFDIFKERYDSEVDELIEDSNNDNE